MAKPKPTNDRDDLEPQDFSDGITDRAALDEALHKGLSSSISSLTIPDIVAERKKSRTA